MAVWQAEAEREAKEEAVRHRVPLRVAQALLLCVVPGVLVPLAEAVPHTVALLQAVGPGEPLPL